METATATTARPTYALCRFLRTEPDFTEAGSASECLSLVRFDADSRYAGEYAVQITSGPLPGDDFVGVYDLDGDQINASNTSWELVDDSEIPAEHVGWEASWERGNSTVRPLAAD